MRAPRNATRGLPLPLGQLPPRGFRGISAVVATALVLCAVVVAAAPLPWPAARWARACTAGALVALAAASTRALGRKRPSPPGWLVVDDTGVHKVDPGAKTTTLLDWI